MQLAASSSEGLLLEQKASRRIHFSQSIIRWHLSVGAYRAARLASDHGFALVVLQGIGPLGIESRPAETTKS